MDSVRGPATAPEPRLAQSAPVFSRGAPAVPRAIDLEACASSSHASSSHASSSQLHMQPLMSLSSSLGNAENFMSVAGAWITALGRKMGESRGACEGNKT